MGWILGWKEGGDNHFQHDPEVSLRHSGITFARLGTAALREPIEGPRSGPVVISCALTEKALRES